MSFSRYSCLLMLVSAPSLSASLSAPNCADAAGRQAAMRRIVLDVPQQGLSAAQVQQALDNLDVQWMRAFGDTAAQPRYQEAVEEYASRVRQLVTVSQRPNAHQDAPVEPLALARREEGLAYTKLQEQAQRACPAPPG